MILCTFENGGTGNLRHAIVDGLVLKDNKILLVKREIKLLEGGKWAMPGGYVNLNENLEQALTRETFEETGYRISDIKLFTIIDSPLRRNDEKQNVAFVFICRVGEKEGIADLESSEQKWFDLNNLPLQKEMAFDHLQIIHAFLKNKDTFMKLIKV